MGRSPDRAHSALPSRAVECPGYSFTYDCNGNLLTRPEPTGTYTQAYDSENRLYSVTVSGQTTTHTYDADGKLVKKVQGGQPMVYVGSHFEQNLSTGQATATTYYFLGGQRVAMQRAGARYYLLTDHLGSTSVTTNQSGGVVAQQFYKPWGESRWSSGTLPTARKFTGQRSEEATLGSLYDYGARAYSPRLSRFLSADTIVPSPGDPQSLNRYSYVLGNPLRYFDPTGRVQQCPDGDVCGSIIYGITPPPPPKSNWVYLIGALVQKCETAKLRSTSANTSSRTCRPP